MINLMAHYTWINSYRTRLFNNDFEFSITLLRIHLSGLITVCHMSIGLTEDPDALLTVKTGPHWNYYPQYIRIRLMSPEDPVCLSKWVGEKDFHRPTGVWHWLHRKSASNITCSSQTKTRDFTEKERERERALLFYRVGASAQNSKVKGKEKTKRQWGGIICPLIIMF